MKVDGELFCLQPSLAWLYSTAASPFERLRSDGSLAISHGNVFLLNFNLKNRIVSQGFLDLKQRTIPIHCIWKAEGLGSAGPIGLVSAS